VVDPAAIAAVILFLVLARGYGSGNLMIDNNARRLRAKPGAKKGAERDALRLRPFSGQLAHFSQLSASAEAMRHLVTRWEPGGLRSRTGMKCASLRRQGARSTEKLHGSPWHASHPVAQAHNRRRHEFDLGLALLSETSNGRQSV
jgi:hypothetical protein